MNEHLHFAGQRGRLLHDAPLAKYTSWRAGGRADTLYIPAEVKRAVWKRDGGCCRWPLASGGVCGSTRRIEYDHIVPFARGGTSTVGNVRLLCATHNELSARQVFGEAWMDRFASRASGHRG